VIVVIGKEQCGVLYHAVTGRNKPGSAHCLITGTVLDGDPSKVLLVVNKGVRLCAGLSH
jgi:hypothetical protein